MNKNSLSIAWLVGTAALLVAIQFGCTKAQPTNPVSVPTPEPTPDKAAIETELTRIENDWPRMIKERDGAAVRRIEADDIVIVYPDGSTGNKEQDAKDIEAGGLTFDSWEISDVKINILDKDSAIVSLRYTVKNAIIKAPDGRTKDISGSYLSLDTFTRRNGQWLLAASTTVKSALPEVTASPTPKVSASPATTPVVKASPSPRDTPAVPRPTPALKGTPVPKPSPAKKPAPTPTRTATP